ncbi:hypothetical protein AB838_16575 [Rhodobacteraceae bacterium (ex Bugula neritina AB1)]|nr:hypothetical protein AB838_16575 [Rhodobacteraceae bacterium (ex Bugula neritina AB1)]
MSDMTPFSYPVRQLAITGLLTLAVLVGGLGYWGGTAEISGAVVARGEVKVEQDRQVVQHPVGGQVEAVFVKEGDSVEKGDLLIRLNSDEIQDDLRNVEGTLADLLVRRTGYAAVHSDAAGLVFAPLMQELQELQSDADKITRMVQGEDELFRVRKETLEARIRQLNERIVQTRSQINGIEAQKVSIADQLGLIRQELADQQALLEKGLAQASRVLALQRQEAQLRGQDGALTAQAARARAQIAELQEAIVSQKSTRRETAVEALRTLEEEERRLREARGKLLSQLEQTEVRAPVSGVVYGQQVNGFEAVITRAEPIMYLVPQDRQLVVIARLRPADRDQVQKGQSVSLKFTGLDQRATKDISGHVAIVSADTLSLQGTFEMYFEVEIWLDEGELSNLPTGAELTPGMEAEVFIKTRPQTLLAYLVQPFTDYLGRAFRER